MVNIKIYKTTLIIVSMSIVSMLFIVYQNHVVFSFPDNLLQRKNLELDEDSNFFLDVEYTDEYRYNSNRTNFNDDDCDTDDNHVDVSSRGWEGRIEQKTDYLNQRRTCILKYCGEVCDTRFDSEKDRVDYEIDDQTDDSLGKLQPGNYANLKLKNKNINCPLLFRSKVHDLPAPSFMKKPFQYIPSILRADYTYDNRVKIYPWYISENFPTNHNENYHSYRDDQWTKDAIDKKIQFVLENDWIGVEGAYTFEETQIVYEMVEKFKDSVIGNQVLVVGSETPWVEAIVLAVGAKNVTTMEYNKIVSTHPQIETVLPEELSKRFASNGYNSLFDVIISYSSIEHSGLTRYGDAPHPWGDLVTMAKNWCYLNDNGMAFIGIPTNKHDKIHFNAHRVYGPLLLSHLFSNFRLKLASWPFKLQPSNLDLQIIFALEKKNYIA